MLVFFVGFIFIHTTMVLTTGLLRTSTTSTAGMNDSILDRVRWIYVIAMAIMVAAWAAATPLTLRYPRAVQQTG